MKRVDRAARRLHRAAWIALAIGALAAALAFSVLHRPAARAWRIGYIQTATVQEQERLTRAFEDAMRARGYVEGRNVVYERRFADGDPRRLPALAADLVATRPDVIVTGGNPVVAAVRQATRTIPVVMGSSRDPVGAGFIASLARPGGNVTGLTNDAVTGIAGKHVELLKELLPRARTIGVLWNPASAGAAGYRAELEAAAATLAVSLQFVEATGRENFDEAFARLASARVDALIVHADPLFFTARERVAALALQHRLPGAFHARELAEAGGLLSYGVSIADQFRRAAEYVDRILKGEKPEALPVRQPETFELVINAVTARSLGIEVPPALALRAELLPAR